MWKAAISSTHEVVRFCIVRRQACRAVKQNALESPLHEMSAEWQFLVTLSERLRPLRDPVKIQEVAVRLLGEHLHVSRVHYVHMEGDEFVVSRSYDNGAQPFPTRGHIARFGTR